MTIPETNSTEITEINQLYGPFSIREIEQVIKSLKRSKSADLDNNVADFFIDSCDFICPYLCTLFNVIFESGSYPDAWSKGVIVPIFKKGDRKNPANYRGITIVNITAKIFSLCLRNRINKWCESEHIFNEQQYGFRENKSTTDAIFLLHTTIQKILSQKSKLYCIFIDYEKAFDTIQRDALWVKLIESGISCKMIQIIKLLYNDVKSCIRLTSSMDVSDFFQCIVRSKTGGATVTSAVYYFH